MEKKIVNNFMNCPTCHTELKMSERSGIEIDYCPQCRGVWLDKGELDKIIERAATESLSQPKNNNNNNNNNYGDKDPYYEGDKNYNNEKYYKQRKRKSFLGDLFDF